MILDDLTIDIDNEHATKKKMRFNAQECWSKQKLRGNKIIYIYINIYIYIHYLYIYVCVFL